MQYAIAVKRKFRNDVPADWVDRIRSVEGLTLYGDPMFGRLIVEASDDTIEEVRSRLGEAFHIEVVTRYETKTGTPYQSISPKSDD